MSDALVDSLAAELEETRHRLTGLVDKHDALIDLRALAEQNPGAGFEALLAAAPDVIGRHRLLSLRERIAPTEED